MTFERFQDPGGVAGHYLEYIIAGLKILREREKARPRVEGTEAFNLVDSFIEPMFFQIQLVTSMFCEPARIDCNNALHLQRSCPDIPQTFPNAESARLAFFRICIWRFTVSYQGGEWLSTSPAFLEVKALLGRWHESLNSLETSLPPNAEAERKSIAAVRGAVQVLVGAILYSVRTDAPVTCSSRPTLVYLQMPSKIAIFTRISNNRKVNLSGINGGLAPWPHAKRVGGPAGENFVVLELSLAETTG